jgi:molybdopterin molybdotransferase
MISVQQATEIIRANTLTALIEEVPLTAAMGRVLREPIRADRDFPPFHRVTMDGIALRFEGIGQGIDTFQVAGIQHAGSIPQSLTNASQCLEVMTGTVLPKGADTVVRYEDLEFTQRDGLYFARLKVAPQLSGQNIHRQATDRKAQDMLLSAGRKLSPADIGVVASVGKSTLKVSQALTIALISTGDELVDIDQEPLPHQIRRSNTYALSAALSQAGAQTELFHLPDNPLLLQQELGSLLQRFDCLVLSGGISMGKADFIPGVLTELGVEKLFHTVAQRPGKPLWFGQSDAGKVVFALPGNPVSTFMCTYRFVLPWLSASLQQKPQPVPKAVLAESVTFNPPLTYFLQVQTFQDDQGRLMARPFPGGGSGDLANLVESQAFLELPSDRTSFEPGEAFDIWKF